MPRRRPLPQVGTEIVKVYRGRTYRVDIVAGGEGQRLARLGTKTFPSLTAVARHITGGAVNGWAFFNLTPVAVASPNT